MFHLKHPECKILQTGKQKRENTRENLAADGLLVLLAAFVSTLVGLDAQTGAAPGARGLAGGAGGFLLILEQLHQQVKLGTAAHLQSQKEGSCLQ